MSLREIDIPKALELRHGELITSRNESYLLGNECPTHGITCFRADVLKIEGMLLTWTCKTG